MESEISSAYLSKLTLTINGKKPGRESTGCSIYLLSLIKQEKCGKKNPQKQQLSCLLIQSDRTTITRNNV